MHTKVGDTFIAQAIVYAEHVGLNGSRWCMLASGRSKKGVMAATEDLWREVQAKVPVRMRGEYRVLRGVGREEGLTGGVDPNVGLWIG